MSYYFYLSAPQLVCPQDLLDRLPGRVFYQGQADANALIGSDSGVFYRPGVSTRGVLVKWLENSYHIGVTTLASREDYALAVEIAEVMAETYALRILPEGEEAEFEAEDFRKHCDDAWLDEMQYLGIEVVKRLLLEGKEVQIQGYEAIAIFNENWIRDQNLAQASIAELYQAFVKVLLRLQALPLQGCRIPNLLIVGDQQASQEYSCMVWIPSQVAFLRQAERVVFDGDTELMFPYAWLTELAGLALEKIDGCQYLAPPLNERQIRELRAQLQQRLQKPRTGKWWQFWKRD